MKKNDGNAQKENPAEPGADKAAQALAGVLFIQINPERLKDLGIEGWEAASSLPVQTPGQLQRFDPAMISPESIVAGILRVLAWQPRHPLAAQYRKLARALKPELLAQLSDAGVAKAHAKDWDVAEEIFLALAGLYPESPLPLLDLALMREERAKLLREEEREALAEEEEDKAYQSYTSLLEMEPPFPPAYYHAALFFIKKRNFDRAVSLLTSYIGLEDDREKVETAKSILAKLQDLGLLDRTFKEAYDFIQLGQEEKGLEKAREFIAVHPDVWNGWFLAGWALRRLGRWNQGAEAFKKAIELNSGDTDSFNELALCQTELGELGAAKASLERALRLEPENVKIIVNLGALAHRMGKTGEARGFFMSALEFDPDDALAKDWLARIGD
ncbi:MAG: tetratricopeptide repeat protein [Spirochaetales bacterium]|nr:tetratricopeptide repeat protein [Spirochaetales bacterium]